MGRPLRLAAILLAGAASPALGAAQDKGAEEAYRQIRESLEKARTVSVRFKFEGMAADPQGGRTVRCSGSIHLKEGNRASLQARTAFGEREVETLMVSDGKTLRAIGGSPAPDRDAPARVGSYLRWALMHSSVMALNARGTAETFDPEAHPPSNLKSGEADKDGRTLSYGLTIAGVALEVRLWYDPKTWRIVKRTLTSTRKGVEDRISETLEVYVLDADVPDHTFKLPGKAPEEAAPAAAGARDAEIARLRVKVAGKRADLAWCDAELGAVAAERLRLEPKPASEDKKKRIAGLAKLESELKRKRQDVEGDLSSLMNGLAELSAPKPRTADEALEQALANEAGPKLYPDTDVAEPPGFNLKLATGVAKAGGQMVSGTLEYAGSGDLAAASRATVAAMKRQGWVTVSEELGDARTLHLMKKGSRTCSLRFENANGALRTTLKVESK